MRGFAALAGVNPSLISRSERGEQVPRAGTIRKLASGLDLSPEETDELLILSGRMAPVSLGDEGGVARRLAALEERVALMEERVRELEQQ